jgi:methyl-accepting chemotaxis protein
MEDMKLKDRKVLLINPDFQLRLMTYFAVIAILVILVFFVADTIFFSNLIMMGRRIGLDEDHIYFAFIRREHHTMMIIRLIAATLAVGGIAAVGLVVSHRIAGPMYRLRKHMIAVANGKTRAEVAFRKNDFFPEVADAYNKQLEALKKDPAGPLSGASGE